MNYDLIMRFSRTCWDYVHPALADAADAIVGSVGTSPEPMNPSVSFAEVTTFVEEFYASIEVQTSSRLFPLLGTSGLMERGRFLTLDTLVPHSADNAYSVCSLAEILEPHVALKYYLFGVACRGVLRRAEKRGRALPSMLRRELEYVCLHFPATLKEAIAMGWDPESPPALEQALRAMASTDQDGAETTT
jgi:hypothetical protein